MIFIIYLILCIISSYILFIEYKYNGLNYLVIFTIYFILAYFLQGLLISYNTDFFNAKIDINSNLLSTTKITPLILIIIFYFFFYIGYKSTNKKNKYLINKKNNNYLLKKISRFSLLLFVFSISIYTYSHNGIVSSLNEAQTIRSGYGVIGKFDIFKRFFYIGIIPFLIAFNRLISKFKLTTMLYVILLLIINIYALLTMAGRTNIILFFLLSIIILGKNKFNIKKALLFLFIFYAIVTFGDSFFIALRNLGQNDYTLLQESDNYLGSTNIFQKMVYEFQYPYTSLVNVIENYNLINYRHINDFIFATINILPDRIFNFGSFDTIAYQNTYMVTGVYDSNIPPGIIAFSIYSLGALGVIFWAFIFGFFFKKIEQLFKYYNFSNNKIFYYITGFKLGGFIIGGEPRVFIFSYFGFLLIVLYYYFLKKINKIRSIKN